MSWNNISAWQWASLFCSLASFSIVMLTLSKSARSVWTATRNGARRLIKESLGLHSESTTWSGQDGNEDLISLIRMLINRKGRIRVPSLTVIVMFSLVMVVASLVLPVQRSAVHGQVVTTNAVLYLPHVSEYMDQWHWIARYDDPSSPNFGKTIKLTFCDYGLRPPWNEGQTITTMTYRVDPYCLMLMGYDGMRDQNGDIVNNNKEE